MTGPGGAGSAATARERAVVEIAARQRGVIARTQLLAAGLGSGAIEARLRSGRLHRLHRGVYLLGGALAVSGAREMAAVLALGPGALVSHRSAARIWGMIPSADGGPVEITVPGRNPRSRPGIRLHRVRALGPQDVGMRSGLPLTSPARTVLDLAVGEPIRVVEQALAEGLRRRMVHRSGLEAMLARCAGRPGTRVLTALIADGDDPAFTRSEAEERLLGLLRAAGLPTPRTNVRVDGHEVDFLWPRERLIVEVDGFAFHSSRVAFERDRRRDAELQASGYLVVRVTWRQIVDEAPALLVRITRVLSVSRS